MHLMKIDAKIETQGYPTEVSVINREDVWRMDQVPIGESQYRPVSPAARSPSLSF